MGKRIPSGGREKIEGEVPLPFMDFEVDDRGKPRRTEEVARRPVYRRYKPNKYNCDQCLEHRAKTNSGPISFASYVRSFQGELSYLCYLHATERRHQDGLG